jgi:hypothetical protein
MRSIKAPSDVPLASSGPSEASKLSAASAYAKMSVIAAMFAVVIGPFAFSGGRRLTPEAAWVVVITCRVLVGAGLVMALLALWLNRGAKRRSVTILAIIGAVISGLLIAANVYRLIVAR